MSRVGALLLTPGAGSDRNQPTLRAIEAALAPLPVARIDFPYRRAGRKAPDRAPVLIECIREEAAALVADAHIRAGPARPRWPLDGRAHVLDGRRRGSRGRAPWCS